MARQTFSGDGVEFVLERDLGLFGFLAGIACVAH